jgi:hypothetical protein
MKQSTFANKLSGNHSASFTEAENNSLCVALIEIRDSLSEVEAADFNDALKILAPKTI